MTREAARLAEPRRSITIRQRRTIGFWTIARTMVTLYPRRTILGQHVLGPVSQHVLRNAPCPVLVVPGARSL